MRLQSFLATATLCALSTSALAQSSTANFDSLPEGPVDFSFVEDGITFFEADAYLGGFTRFVIEQADGTLGGPFFSPPNAMTMSGYVPGPSAGFSRMGSFKMTTNDVRNFVSLDLFVADNSRNTITLEATLGGAAVASTAATLQGTNSSGVHHSLELDGVDFDELRLVGSGAFQSGAWFGMVDNVVIEVVAACPADLNGDGVVDLADLGILLADFGCTAGPGNCSGDIDGDGDTDLADLGILLANFGVVCP